MPSQIPPLGRDWVHVLKTAVAQAVPEGPRHGITILLWAEIDPTPRIEIA